MKTYKYFGIWNGFCLKWTKKQLKKHVNDFLVKLIPN